METSPRFETRVEHCRFKSVFSPYRDKKLGEFFEPILVRRRPIGASYRLPSSHPMQTGQKGYRGYVFSRSVTVIGCLSISRTW
jgi:hypothetical protein